MTSIQGFWPKDCFFHWPNKEILLNAKFMWQKTKKKKQKTKNKTKQNKTNKKTNKKYTPKNKNKTKHTHTKQKQNKKQNKKKNLKCLSSSATRDWYQHVQHTLMGLIGYKTGNFWNIFMPNGHLFLNWDLTNAEMKWTKMI